MHQFRGPAKPSGSTDAELLERLGQRIAAARLRVNWTQTDLAREAGVSRATLQRLEGGGSSQLTNLIRVLRALGSEGRILDLVPIPPPSPIEAVKRARSTRQRASRRSRGRAAKESATGEWTWGDEG